MRYSIAALAVALFAASASTSAQTSYYGDWVVVRPTLGLQIAKTSTDNLVTGIACAVRTDSCFAYVGTDSPCTEGQRVPMLLSSVVAAWPIWTKCTQIGDSLYNIIEEFDSARNAMESGNLIGFAMPLLSGEFRVVRFSTRGATAAIRDARTRPQQAPSDSIRRNDVRL